MNWKVKELKIRKRVKLDQYSRRRGFEVKVPQNFVKEKGKLWLKNIFKIKNLNEI